MVQKKVTTKYEKTIVDRSDVLEVKKLNEEINNLRLESKNLTKPLFKRLEFWALLIPVFTLLGMTVWENFLSPINNLKLEAFRSNAAAFKSTEAAHSLNVQTLENQKVLLEIETKELEEQKENLEDENAKLVTAKEQHQNDVVRVQKLSKDIEDENIKIKNNNDLLKENNTKLKEREVSLTQEVGRIRYEIKTMENEESCRQIEEAINDIARVGFALAAFTEHYNFAALATISEREGYADIDTLEAIRNLGYSSWYSGWAVNANVGAYDNPLAQSFAAQLIANTVSAQLWTSSATVECPPHLSS